MNAVISLAHTPNLRLVAEGLETEEQSTILTPLARDEMQGFPFSRRVLPDDVPAFLLRQEQY